MGILAMTFASAPFPPVRAPNGMVCAVDHLAASAGVAILRDGGSAVDAAVATNAVLAVTTQNLCGMGGDLFALVHEPGSPAPACLVASGRAGSGADPARLRSEGHERMPFTDDIRSVPVPGCVDGWVALHQRFGQLPLTDVLEPAGRYAQRGFPAAPLLALMAPFVDHLPGAAPFARTGGLQPGDRVRRPGIAEALAAIAAEGRDAFYLGAFGHGLIALGEGEFSESDLERPNADWVEPLALDVWGHRIWTTPPPTQGYLTLAGGWIAEAAGIGATTSLEPDSADWAHLLVEAAKQAGHDRPAVLHEHASGPALLDPERLASRAAAIDPSRAAELSAPANPGDTTYLCVIDGDGMACSLIQSNAAGFGANLVVDPPGVFLHNRGIGFSLEAGHPAEYGPRRRPPHTLSPALVTHPDGRLHSVLGTMGGDSQPQILLQLLARLLVAGQDPATALAAGRWVLRAPAAEGGFATWRRPGDLTVAVEGHVSAEWPAGLEARGHAVKVRQPFDVATGHAHAIVVHDDHLVGAADPRSGAGAAAGW